MRCLHCKAEYSRHFIRGRGLCRHCHKEPGVRDEYPSGRGRNVARGVRPWTAAERLLLADLRGEGLQAAEIARRLGRGRWGVFHQLRRMGLSKERGAA